MKKEISPEKLLTDLSELIGFLDGKEATVDQLKTHLKKESLIPKEDGAGHLEVYNIAGELVQKIQYCKVCRNTYPMYVAKKEVWKEAGLNPYENVCIFCLEKLLERPLSLKDFAKVVANSYLVIGYILGERDR